MICWTRLPVGAMRKTVLQRIASVTQYAPKLTLDGTSTARLLHCFVAFYLISKMQYHFKSKVHSFIAWYWILFCWFPVCFSRARSLDAARELFWNQADFGYVKKRRSELKTLCKASKPVSLLISLFPTGLQSKQEDTTSRNRSIVVAGVQRQTALGVFGSSFMDHINNPKCQRLGVNSINKSINKTYL